MILLDTSGIIAALFEDQKHHAECAQVLRETKPPLLISPFVLAEVDYLITKYGSIEAELMFLQDIAKGAYSLVQFKQEWIDDTWRMVHRYRHLNIGLADASLIMLAEAYNCRDLLTLDLRHFRAMRPISKKSFRILPADRDL